jgi:hypothetical protein
MTSTRSTLLAFVFGILLLLPTLDQLFGLTTRFGSTENRQASNVPPLNFPHVRSFAKKFDQYYKENFGGRNALFYAYSRWKLNVLGESPLPEKVVVGKNGWFYLGNSYNNVINQHRGLQPLSADSAQYITNHLLKRQQELALQGIRLYVMVAPDSHSIYPEFLPDRMGASPAPSRLDALKQAIQQTDLPFIDVRDTLISTKPHHVVYNKTDTHWNDYGTMIGSATLLERIRQDQPTIPPMQSSDFRIEQQKGVGGDLVRMLTVQDEQKDPIYYYIQPSGSRTARQVATEPNNLSGFPSTRFISSGRGKLLFIGDSFSHSMMQFLPAYFRESYFIRGRQLNPDIVQKERPDIVVIEVVERNINFLGNF